jgi:hypothetical protein
MAEFIRTILVMSVCMFTSDENANGAPHIQSDSAGHMLS